MNDGGHFEKKTFFVKNALVDQFILTSDTKQHGDDIIMNRIYSLVIYSLES